MKQTGLLDVLKAQERVVSELSKEILRLRAENDKLRAALHLYANRLNWHYERLGSERVHPNEVNLYSWEGIEHQQPWQIALAALKDGDA